MEIQSPTRRYRVGDEPVGETETHRLYLCREVGTERSCVLQIALETSHNEIVDRSAFFLMQLQKRAEELEVLYAKTKKDKKQMLNYGLGFPELVETFIVHQPGRRRINILAFRGVENAGTMLPISNIIIKDRQRVNLETSVWIMGKALKMIAFAHDQFISVGCVNETNLLLDRQQHFVVLFDWSYAKFHTDTLDPETRRAEIMEAARAVVTLLGGDLETGRFPIDDGSPFVQYTDHLMELARGRQYNASKAHERFYQLVDELWERKFYPFTTYNR